MDDTNFVDDVGANFYINDVDEADEAAHGDGSNNLSGEECWYMLEEERPKQGNIGNGAYVKYIGTRVMTDVSGEGPRRVNVRCCVEDLDRAKVVMYHHNPLMDTQ